MQRRELEKLKAAAEFAKEVGLRVAAGHGLNYTNVKAITDIVPIEELNIGHSIIAHSVYVGLREAVKEILALIR
jgi:pyridoxine 5-phosphate synthase